MTAGVRGRRSRRGRGRCRLLALLTSLLALAACGSLDEAEVDGLEELDGVRSAYGSCVKGVCHLDLDVEATAAPADLVAALAQARETGADEIGVDLVGADAPARLTLSDAAPEHAGDEPALVDAVLATTRLPGVTEVAVEAETETTLVQVMAEGAGPGRVWDLAEETWPLLGEAPGPALVVDNRRGAGLRRVATGDGFPTAAVDLVRALEAAAGAESFSGIDVRADQVVLGVRRLADVAPMERRVARTRRGTDGAALPGPVRVVVTDNVLADHGDTEADRRAVLAVLEDHPDVTPSVDGRLLTLAGTDADAVARAVADARSRVPSAAAEVPVRALLDDVHEVRLETTGPPDLVRLAGALRGSGTTSVEVRFDDPVRVLVEVRASDLPTGVLRVARVLRTRAGGTAPLVVTVQAVDPEGRSPTSTAGLTRTGGRWQVDVHRPDLLPAGVGAAWREGLGSR